MFFNKTEVEDKTSTSTSDKMLFKKEDLLDIDKFIYKIKNILNIERNEEEIKQILEDVIEKYKLKEIEVSNNLKTGKIIENFVIDILKQDYSLTQRINKSQGYNFIINNKYFVIRMSKPKNLSGNIHVFDKSRKIPDKNINIIIFGYYNDEIYYNFSLFRENIKLNSTNLGNWKKLETIDEFKRDFDDFYKNKALENK